jgi:hypothetical protein
MLFFIAAIFFVALVDVTGRGCFAPWTRVLMNDGSQKTLLDVRIGDQVASWDAYSGRPASASVIGVHVFAAGDLHQIQPEATHTFDGKRLLRHAKENLTSLVLTADHPVYSARQNGLVSMSPRSTLESYGIAAEQMFENDVMVDHSGKELRVHISPYQRNFTTVPVVMTLSLDPHHWFYAEGLRVHNKGTGGGGGHGGHRAGPGNAHHRGNYHGHGLHSWTKTHGMAAHRVAALMVIGSRRRHGIWTDSAEDSCRLKAMYRDNTTALADRALSSVSTGEKGETTTAAPHTDASGIKALDHTCTKFIGSYAKCVACNACTDISCTQAISGCDKFIGEIFYECRGGDATEGKKYMNLPLKVWRCLNPIFFAPFAFAASLIICKFAGVQGIGRRDLGRYTPRDLGREQNMDDTDAGE